MENKFEFSGGHSLECVYISFACVVSVSKHPATHIDGLISTTEKYLMSGR